MECVDSLIVEMMEKEIKLLKDRVEYLEGYIEQIRHERNMADSRDYKNDRRL